MGSRQHDDVTEHRLSGSSSQRIRVRALRCLLAEAVPHPSPRPSRRGPVDTGRIPE